MFLKMSETIHICVDGMAAKLDTILLKIMEIYCYRNLKHFFPQYIWNFGSFSLDVMARCAFGMTIDNI